ncbi:fatty acid synthase, putative [Ixodes scapularis]|uniref:Fatty acid synthase, putative n=1 Tax=Ixodes scapularis TaxID=6945 RepID=B7QKF2_IXOSC|nr:fatty acid synthase, putative [Ixodes scapularis]|eukprot:XP_002415657.1 fatty acid synthase, putative [Ixodes scapularis]
MADEDVVITGFSAYFPQANHLTEFRKKLYDGVDMVTDDEARWPRGTSSWTDRPCFLLSSQQCCWQNCLTGYGATAKPQRQDSANA